MKTAHNFWCQKTFRRSHVSLYWSLPSSNIIFFHGAQVPELEKTINSNYILIYIENAKFHLWCCAVIFCSWSCLFLIAKKRFATRPNQAKVICAHATSTRRTKTLVSDHECQNNVWNWRKHSIERTSSFLQKIPIVFANVLLAFYRLNFRNQIFIGESFVVQRATNKNLSNNRFCAEMFQKGNSKGYQTKIKRENCENGAQFVVSEKSSQITC